jgi:hypothetical protein
MTKTGSLKKWLSLSAMSAAGVAVGGTSLADVIYHSVNQNVGNLAGDQSSITLTLPGINDMRVFYTTGPFTNSVRMGGVTGATYFNVHRYVIHTVSNANYPFFAQPSPKGQKWSSVAGTVGGAGNLGAVSHTFQPGFPAPYTNHYFDFAFKDTTAGGALRYGWLQASLTTAPQPGSQVEVNVVAYAYDTTGAELGAGLVPEPASILAGGFGALVLGALGVRRWRKGKQEAAI